MPGYQSAGKAALVQGENRVIWHLIRPGPKGAGDQVLPALQHTAGEAVPPAEQAQLPGDRSEERRVGKECL